MELRHLRYFIAAAEAGHFHRAAEKLNVTQPALSRQIQALEKELAVTLFERLPRGVRLSEAGRIFLEEAKGIVEETDQILERMRRLGRGEVGTLRLACSEAASAHRVVSEAIRNFRAAEPDVELSLSHLASSEQIAALDRKQIDAGFVFRSAIAQEAFASCELAELDLLVAIPQSHPLAAAPRLRLSMLKDQPLIVVAQRINPHFYDTLMMAFAKGGLVPRVIQEANSGIVLSLVSVGMGVGLVSSAMQSRAPSDVVLRRLDDLTLSTHLDLVWRRDNTSAALQRFVASVVALMREQDGRRSRHREVRGNTQRQGSRR